MFLLNKQNVAKGLVFKMFLIVSIQMTQKIVNVIMKSLIVRDFTNGHFIR